MEKFLHPKFLGEIKDADGKGKIGNPVCGDMMEVFIKVARNKDGEEYIKDIKVKTFGCVAAISSSEVMCEIVKGKTLAEAEEISNKAILKELGEVPPQKVHCSVLAADALRNAIKDYKS